VSASRSARPATRPCSSRRGNSSRLVPITALPGYGTAVRAPDGRTRRIRGAGPVHSRAGPVGSASPGVPARPDPGPPTVRTAHPRPPPRPSGCRPARHRRPSGNPRPTGHLEATMDRTAPPAPPVTRRGVPPGRRVRAALAVLAAATVTLALTPSAQADTPAQLPGRRLAIDVLTSAPHQVSGGDALLRVLAGPLVDPSEVRITVARRDVTGAFTPDAQGHSLTGLVDGLALGDNEVRARAGTTGPTARL